MPATYERKPFPWPNGATAAVSLTFDDSRLSQIDHGIPILNAAGLRGTFYISPSHFEGRLDGWKAALADGHEIGNHSMTHPCTGNYSWSRTHVAEDHDLRSIARDIDEAQDYIQAEIGVRPVTFAYPCGRTTVGRGVNSRSYVPVVAERFLIGRDADLFCVNVPGIADPACAAGCSMDDQPFESVKRLVDMAVRESGWLILYGHETAPERKVQLTTTTEVLSQLCEYLASRKEIWTDTVAAVGRHFVDKTAGLP